MNTLDVLDLDNTVNLNLSPKSAVFSNKSRLLHASDYESIKFFSPTQKRPFPLTPRENQTVVPKTIKRRGRNNSQEFVPAFPQTMYDTIEDFLDKEGLFLETPSPNTTRKVLKPVIKLIRIQTNPEIGFNKSLNRLDVDSDSELPLPTMPTILARRTSSAGVGKNIKHSLLNLAKANSNHSNMSVITTHDSQYSFKGLEICCSEEVSPLQ